VALSSSATNSSAPRSTTGTSLMAHSTAGATSSADHSSSGCVSSSGGRGRGGRGNHPPIASVSVTCAGDRNYQLKIVWAHYGTPLGWELLFNNDKGLKSQCCTGLLLMMSIAGLTLVKLVIDVINDVYYLLKFAIFFI
jgi:hypothetical protein